jgi:undecaprenyl diphosphate synthase
LTLGFALNYGSRRLIVVAVRTMALYSKVGTVFPDAFDVQTICYNIYTAGWHDPDLVVRTSGEMRISNFLLWQISYAEFYVTDVHWPDFTLEELDKSLLSYANRQRRFGDTQPKTPTQG